MNKRFAPLGLSFLLLLLLLAGAAQASISPFLLTKLKDSVVLIDVTLTLPDNKEGGARGSGFLISADGQIVTNAHVVSLKSENDDGTEVTATARDIKIIFHPGTPQSKTYTAQVLRENPDLDLALLKVDLPTPSFLEFADSDAAEETTTIYVCGHPLGLDEFSIRSGSITAHRTWENHKYLEHDAMAESGNSGGPVVDGDGRVLGIHSLTLGKSNLMKFAIPSNVVSDWLKTPESQDPQPVKPGAELKDLLDAAKLHYAEKDGGFFDLAYDNDITVHVHHYKDFLRVYVPLGEIEGDTDAEKGTNAKLALRFNYTDPVGRMSIWSHDGKLDLYWEAQVPFSVASGDYLRVLADAAASQAKRWGQVVAGEKPGDPDNLYPGGNEDAQLADLKAKLEASGIKFEAKDKFFKLAYDNDIIVFVSLIKGMAWTHTWVGGMPGGSNAGKGQKALELLQRNWDDEFGRLSLDSDGDVIWESQVPCNLFTPTYLAILANACADQAASYKKVYGDIPLNGG